MKAPESVFVFTDSSINRRAKRLHDPTLSSRAFIIFFIVTILIAIGLLLAPKAHATNGSWNVNSDGVWSNSANWLSGNIADGAGSTGNFTFNISTGGGRTITIDGAVASRTLGIMNIGDTDGSSPYTIAASGGGTLTFDNGGSNAQLNETSTSKGDTISAPILLKSSLDITNASANTLTISGTIGSSATSGTQTVSLLSGNATISGAISNGGTGGTIALAKSGSGTLTLSGGNTYTGATSVTSGTLKLGAAGALGNGTSNTSGITVSSGAALDLGGFTPTASVGLNLNGQFSSTVGALTNSGAAASYGGTVTLQSASSIGGSGNITLSNDISGAFALTKVGADTLILTGSTNGSTTTTISAGTLQIGNGGTSGTLGSGAVTDNAALVFNRSDSITVSNAISGSGAVTQGGGSSSVTTLSGTDSYTGATSVTSGTLKLGAAGALGNGTNNTSGVTVSSGAALDLGGFTPTANVNLNLNGTGISSGGALTNSGSAATYGGTVTLQSDSSIGGSGDITLSNTISGGFAVTKVGADTLTLSGANTYTRATSIQNGILSVSSLNSVSGGSASSNLGAPNNTANGTIAIGATTTTGQLTYTGSGQTTDRVINLAGTTGGATLDDSGTGTLTFSSDFTATGVGAKTLTLQGSTAGSGVISGKIVNSSSGATSVTKSGSGTWTLSGANTFTGATTVNGGTLTAAATSGSALGSTSSVTVNSGGTVLLGASNQINNSASMTLAGGTFAKGNFSEGSTSTAGVGALTLTATGSHLDFGTGTVGTLTFASFSPGGNTLLIDNWTGTANTIGNASTDRLVFNSDQTSNLSDFWFTGYAPGASEFSLGGGFFEITPTVIPEPSTWLAGALALGAVLYTQRRRFLSPRAVIPRPRNRRFESGRSSQWNDAARENADLTCFGPVQVPKCADSATFNETLYRSPNNFASRF